MTLDEFETLAGIFQSAVTAIGIIVAGTWTFLHFKRQRHGYPHAAVHHSSHTFRLNDGRTLLRIEAKITNIGGVLVPLRYARTRVQHLFPLPDHIALLAAACDDPVPKGDCELPWTVLGAREWPTNEGVGEIEPTESEVLHSDFIIPAGVEQVLAYTYVSNHAKSDREIGWSDTVVISLRQGTEINATADASGTS